MVRSRIVLAHLGLFALLLAAVCATGCDRREFHAVEMYKGFLDEAKPSLVNMNDARDKLMNIQSTDEIVPLFREKLMPEVHSLQNLANKTTPPAEVDALVKIHDRLKGTLNDYAEKTDDMLKRLEAARDDKERETALLEWGEADKSFGDGMTRLVKELKEYLEKVKRG